MCSSILLVGLVSFKIDLCLHFGKSVASFICLSFFLIEIYSDCFFISFDGWFVCARVNTIRNNNLTKIAHQNPDIPSGDGLYGLIISRHQSEFLFECKMFTPSPTHTAHSTHNGIHFYCDEYGQILTRTSNGVLY